MTASESRTVTAHEIFNTITLDGFGNTHDCLRPYANGAGTFDQIMSNMRNIHANIKNKFLHITIRTNLTKQILKEFSEFLLFLDREFGDDSRFTHLIRLAMDWGGDRIESIREDLLPKDSLPEIYQRIAKLPIRYRCYGNIGSLRAGGFVCRSTFLNRICIGTDGRVSKCENTEEENKVGFLEATGALDLDLMKTVQWTIGHRLHAAPVCDDCAYSMLCYMSTCPAIYVRNKPGGCLISREVRELLKLAYETGMITELSEGGDEYHA